jgi:hypothetical protein
MADSVDWKSVVSRVKRVSIETYQAGKARPPRHSHAAYVRAHATT